MYKEKIFMSAEETSIMIKKRNQMADIMRIFALIFVVVIAIDVVINS